MKYLLSILCLFVLSCDDDNNSEGCTDINACNFNENATVDDDSCYYSEDACTLCDAFDYIVCTDDWTPVCGCNGLTYSNACYASVYVISAIPGECNN